MSDSVRVQSAKCESFRFGDIVATLSSWFERHCIFRYFFVEFSNVVATLDVQYSDVRRS